MEHTPKLQSFNFVFLKSTESRVAPFWSESLDTVHTVCESCSKIVCTQKTAVLAVNSRPIHQVYIEHCVQSKHCIRTALTMLYIVGFCISCSHNIMSTVDFCTSSVQNIMLTAEMDVSSTHITTVTADFQVSNT